MAFCTNPSGFIMVFAVTRSWFIVQHQQYHGQQQSTRQPAPWQTGMLNCLPTSWRIQHSGHMKHILPMNARRAPTAASAPALSPPKAASTPGSGSVSQCRVRQQPVQMWMFLLQLPCDGCDGDLEELT